MASLSPKEGSDEELFPSKLRILVVDDDPLCLMVVEKMLKRCNYEVKSCNRAKTALGLLRDNSVEKFDLVLSDVYMPDMDGMKLLETIGLELDLPVIMMSANGETQTVMRGITHGAVDYLLKPVRIEELKNIWQHVVRKKTKKGGTPKGRLPRGGSANGSDGWGVGEGGSGGEDDEKRGEGEDVDDNEGGRKAKRQKKDAGDEEDEDFATMKKARVVWSVELHQQFVNAVNQLGIEKAVPKRILDLMNVSGLTRENVASHLQKYRLYLKRLSGEAQNMGIAGGVPFVGGHDRYNMMGGGMVAPMGSAMPMGQAMGGQGQAGMAMGTMGIQMGGGIVNAVGGAVSAMGMAGGAPMGILPAGGGMGGNVTGGQGMMAVPVMGQVYGGMGMAMQGGMQQMGIPQQMQDPMFMQGRMGGGMVHGMEQQGVMAPSLDNHLQGGDAALQPLGHPAGGLDPLGGMIGNMRGMPQQGILDQQEQQQIGGGVAPNQDIKAGDQRQGVEDILSFFLKSGEGGDGHDGIGGVGGGAVDGNSLFQN